MLSGAIVATGMAYSLFWAPVVRGVGVWLSPNDIWSTVRAAHYVGWGSIGYVYGAHLELLTLPGFPVLLAPFAMLSSALGLTESIPGYLLHPTAWLLIGPVVLAVTAVPLVSLDMLASHLGVAARRRACLSFFEAVLLWPVVALWGHPEDVLALGLVAFALLAASGGRADRAGWLVGAAICCKLDVVLVVFVVAAALEPRLLARFAARTLGPPAALAAICFGADPADTWHALVGQSSVTGLGYHTPLIALAQPTGHDLVREGPIRLLSVAAAVGTGWWASRHRHDLCTLVWAAGLALAARALAESVLFPYYLVPAVCLLLVVATGRSDVRVLNAGVAGAGLTAVLYWHGPPWPRWLMVIALLCVVAAAAQPRRRDRPDTRPQAGASGSTSGPPGRTSAGAAPRKRKVHSSASGRVSQNAMGTAG